MKAIVQMGYGPPERVLRLQEIEPPTLRAGDALVRVRATSVNTPDWISVAGIPYILRPVFGLRGPRTPVRGTDVAGVVEAVGADVTDLRPGDEVFGSSWEGTLSTRGTFAELTAVPASGLIRKRPGIGFEQAGASVMSGLTALAAMQTLGKVGPGMRVLVNGASGGVGTLAVQIARSLGAEVTGVCSTRNLDLVRSLWAARAIDYTREDFTRGDDRYDLILDNVLNQPPSATARVLAPGGVLMPNSVGNTGGLLAGLPRIARAGLLRLGSTNVRFVSWKVGHENLGSLAGLLERREVRVVISEIHPLADTPNAVAHMLGHHAVGKVAISVQRRFDDRRAQSRGPPS